MMTPNDLPQTFHRSSLEGKVAVVTGGTQGLGEATLRLFRDRGCRGLVITGRNVERGERLANELASASCKTVFIRANLENIDEVRNILKVTDETFGTLDILVNAAATTDRGSLWDTTPEDYDRIMNVNTRAPFFLTQDAARIMEREKVAGSIINISSTASYGSMPMLAAYGMSKGALNVATKNAAYSLMWSKIRVNALAIGWMDTPGEDAIQRRLHSGEDGNGHHWKEAGEANQPFGRLLQADEVARCIAFCASDESGMMTGCVIDFDQSVWGAGNAPVPPRKDQWARANGMTFSFQSNEDDDLGEAGASPPQSASRSSRKSDSKASYKSKSLSSSSHRKSPRSTPHSSPSVTRQKSPGYSAINKRTPRASPKPESTADSSSSSDSEGIKAKAKSSDSNRHQPKTRESSKSIPRLPFAQSPKTPGEAKPPIQIDSPVSTRWPPIPNLTPEMSRGRLSSKKTANDGNKEKVETGSMKERNEKHTEASTVVPLIPPSLRDSPPSKNPKSLAPKQSKSADATYPDEDRPDPALFKLMLYQEEEDPNRPDDYLPGSDPYPGSQRRKERAQKKYGNSHGENHQRALTKSPKSPITRPPKSPRYPRSPKETLSDKSKSGEDGNRTEGIVSGTKEVSNDDHRTLKVDEWLNSPKTQRRSWRVKQVREIHG